MFSKRSTETVLLKVQSDILNAVDRQEVVLLVMLDLSAAFDTIDRVVLLQHLQTTLVYLASLSSGLDFI